MSTTSAVIGSASLQEQGPEDDRRIRSRSAILTRKAIAGWSIIGFFVLLAIFGPTLAPYNPSASSGASLIGPSAHHLLGTTQSGQDVFSQVLVGTRTTLLVGFVAGIIAKLLAIAVGVTAGYLGSVVDDVLSAFSNIVLVIPTLPLVIAITAYLPSRGVLTVAIVIAATGWASSARVLRAQTLSIRRRDYVLSAKAVGERAWRIILFELLPNEIAILASGFLFAVIFAILTQTSLAFLGLTDITIWSWGTILYWAQNNSALNLGAWWWFVPPGLCVALLGMGLSLLNFAVDETINPRLVAVRSK